MLSLADYVKHPSGLFVLDVFRRGKLIEHVEERNLIVDNSKAMHAHLLGGDATNNVVTKFGVGTNGTAPAGGNTTLTGAFIKAHDGATYPVAGQVSFAFSLSTSEANGIAILEFALLGASNTLYARKVRSVALNKASDLTLSGVWSITF